MSKKFRVADEARFSDNRFAPHILQGLPHFRVVVIALRKGQEIQPHPGDDGAFYVVAGEGVFYAEEGDIEIAAGDVVIVEAGERRGMAAVDDLVVLVARAAQAQ